MCSVINWMLNIINQPTSYKISGHYIPYIHRKSNCQYHKHSTPNRARQSTNRSRKSHFLIDLIKDVQLSSLVVWQQGCVVGIPVGHDAPPSEGFCLFLQSLWWKSSCWNEDENPPAVKVKWTKGTFFSLFFSFLFLTTLQLYCPNRILRMGNLGCFPWGKPAATLLCMLAVLVFP